MLYCRKCHALQEDGRKCSTCEELLETPAVNDLILLTAATPQAAGELERALQERSIAVQLKPAMVPDVTEVFVQYADLEAAQPVLEAVQNEFDQREPEEQPEMSPRKKWVVRIVSAAAFALLVWGVVALTDFVIALVQSWIR